MTLSRPSLMVNTSIVQKNIQRMLDKVSRNIQFRPHFKTHQNYEVGQIYRSLGIDKITVSSVEMAEFFANDGWTDILIATPLNILQIQQIKTLSKRINLGVLISSLDTLAIFLRECPENNLDIWIEIDAGYGRTGFSWQKKEVISQCIDAIAGTLGLSRAKGILTHSGHSYLCKTKNEIEQLYWLTLDRMKAIKASITRDNWGPLISTGDTPCCSIMSSFEGNDEIRPGNFAYYDLTQESIGSCRQSDIAVAVAVPVIGIYPERQHIMVYGGGVHFSKDYLDTHSEKIYGYLVEKKIDRWDPIDRQNRLIKLSQEHGTLQASSDLIRSVSVGDILYIQPVHSCLSADLLKANTMLI